MFSDEFPAIGYFILTILGYLPVNPQNEYITKYEILKSHVTNTMALMAI